MKKIILIILGIISGIGALLFFVFNFIVSKFKVFNLIDIIVIVLCIAAFILVYKFVK